MNKTDELLEVLGNNRQFVVNSFYDAAENYGHKKIVVLPHEDGGYPDVYLCFKDKNDKLGEFASWTRDEFEADEKLVEAVAQIADTIYSETVDTINWEIEQGVRSEFRFIAYDEGKHFS